jgi:hypothetical protein
MTLGKLFGTTAYAWYGVLLCLAVLLASGGGLERGATLLLRCLFAHAAALFASLVLLALGGRALVLTSLPHLVGILAGAGAELPLMWLGEAGGWFGLAVDGVAFALISLALFWGWCVAGCVRLMGSELSVPQRPWLWPAFVLFLAAYAAGLGWGEGRAAALGAGFLAVSAAVAAASLLEPKSRTRIARLLKGELDVAPPSLQALLVAALLAAVLGVAVAAPPSRLGVDFTTVLPLAVVLFLARDIALTRLVSLRRGGLRGALLAVVWFAVLYAALPVLLAGAGADALLVLLLPISAEGASAATLFALGSPGLQAAALWALLARRVGASPASEERGRPTPAASPPA